MVLVTGQTVVDIAMVEVTTLVAPPPGQEITSRLQLVTVTTVVLKTVEVVKDTVVDGLGKEMEDDDSVGPELLSFAADEERTELEEAGASLLPGALEIEETMELEGAGVMLLASALDTELLELRAGTVVVVTLAGLQSNSIR